MDDKRLERIEIKIDDIGDHLASIDTTLGAQHVSLRDHMRRTVILEKEILPLIRRKAMVDGVVAALTLLAGVAGIIEMVHKFL